METLADLIRRRKEAIVEAWIGEVSRLPSAQGEAWVVIADHIHAILDRLADMVEHADAPAAPLNHLSHAHAVQRLQTGRDLRQVISEYSILRRVLVREQHAQMSAQQATPESLSALVHLHDAIDRAIVAAAEEYAASRERAQDLMVGILSHDLRQPLHAIRFGVDLLQRQEPPLPPSAQKALARLRVSARRMELLINDLLDFTRVRMGGGLPVTPRPIDAIAVIRHAVEEIAEVYPQRDIRCPGCRGRPLHAEWDEQRILQAVANLIGNAMVHGTDPVEIDVAEGGEEIAIQIRNRGDVSRERLEQLFQPFRPEAAGRRPAGLGIGLYIVREIARAHGGSVSAESEHGTITMTLRLPRIARAATSAGSPSSEEPRAGRASW